jgi:hypothetical protein
VKRLTLVCKKAPTVPNGQLYVIIRFIGPSPRPPFTIENRLSQECGPGLARRPAAAEMGIGRQERPDQEILTEPLSLLRSGNLDRDANDHDDPQRQQPMQQRHRQISRRRVLPSGAPPISLDTSSSALENVPCLILTQRTTPRVVTPAILDRVDHQGFPTPDRPSSPLRQWRKSRMITSFIIRDISG